MKTIMLRCLCIVAAIILLPCCVCAESNISIPVKSIMLGQLNMSASALYADQQARTQFVTAALMDCFIVGNKQVTESVTDALINDTIYVSKDGLTLAIYFWGTNACVLITYTPYLDDIKGWIIDTEVTSEMAAFVMASLEDSGAIGGYYHAPSEDIIINLYQIIIDNSES